MPTERDHGANEHALPPPSSDGTGATARPALARGRFGGTERQRAADAQPDVPATRDGLARGALDLAVPGGMRISWPVLASSSAVILAFSAWTILRPAHARGALEWLVGWISSVLGWYYVLTMALVILFVLWVALSRHGTVRLGPDDSRPQYSLATWVAMLFAAGVGIDLLFFSVTGPVVQYLTPPTGDGGSAAALQDAVVWTMFHYGIAGWAVYALLGMSMGYFAYRWGMPLSIRAALYPLLGRRMKGLLGDGISMLSLVGTVFGVATSMGIGVVLLGVGFARIFGLQDGLGLEIALVVGAVVLTIAATTSGVDRGIRWISELNLWSALAMMLFILVAGQTAFLLNALVENVGRFLVTLPSRMLQTFAYRPGSADWMAHWTLFFWAFWLAWGPFVGVFLARISRGRTLREFVIAAITVPVLCDFIIVSLFGNSALYHVLQGDTAFAALAVESPERGWYALLGMFPGAIVLIVLATFSGLLFYLTSANSGAMVMSNFSALVADPAHDGPKWLRVFWAVLTAVLTIAMLMAGGVVTMEYATLVFALPVTVVAYLVMAAFHKALRMEQAARDGAPQRSAAATAGGHVPERSWKQRLGRLLAYPSRREVARYLERTVEPALDDIAAEFTREGYVAERDSQPAGVLSSPRLRVGMGDAPDFVYLVTPVAAPVPTFSGKLAAEADIYYRLDVVTANGPEGYDLMGLTRQQVIDDVLDRYEAHLAAISTP